MKSHTTPKRLRKQFSYKHPVEQSDWLWQYRKGKKPNGRKSPTSATRIDGFYADPNDSAIEAEVETRLAQEIEQPVNDFMDEVCDPGFVLTDERKLSAANSSKSRLGFGISGHLQPARQFLGRQLPFSGSSVTECIHQGQQFI